jgi:hypothetical protein
MKITYTENPLNTVVELDDHEKEVFKLKLKLKEYEEMLFDAHFHLQEDKQWFDIEKVRKALNPDHWCTDDESPVDKRVNEMFEHYLEELAGSHHGDCVCFAMTCSKCMAEDILGIWTIKGLGKHPAHKIDSLFRSGKNIHEAVDELEDYNPTYVPNEGWERAGGKTAWEQHLPRWQEEAKVAAIWLRNYRDEHFPIN